MEHAPRKMREEEQGSCFRRLTIAGCLLVATGLSLLTGCATAGKSTVEQAVPAAAIAAQSAPSVPMRPTVVHFTDGREGFVITESYGMKPQERAEFDQASGMIREGKYDAAIGLLEKVIKKAPEMTAPHINIAIAYGRANKPELAEPHLKIALAAIPGHPVASNEYGLLLRKAGRFAEARSIYEKSLALFPEYYPIHKNLAILCDLYLKDAACAVEHYEIYGKAMPKDPQVKLWLADLQTRSRGTMTASAHLQSGPAHPDGRGTE